MEDAGETREMEELAAALKNAAPPRPASVPPKDSLLAGASEELSKLYDRALWLGGQGRAPLVSYTTLFLAFLGGGTPTADWVRGVAEELALDLSKVLAHWASRDDGSYPKTLTHAQIWSPEPAGRLADDITPSARRILDLGREVQKLCGAPRVEAHHVIAAFFALPGAGTNPAKTWGQHPGAWTARVAVYLAQREPQADAVIRKRIGESVEYDDHSNIGSLLMIVGSLAFLASDEKLTSQRFVMALGMFGRLRDGPNGSAAWLAQHLDPKKVPSGFADIPATNDIGLKWDFAKAEPDVAALFDTARFYALAADDQKLHVRHVVAAVLSPRGPAAGKRTLRDLGGDPRRMAREFTDLIAKSDAKEDIGTWNWLRIHDAPRVPRRKPGYINDAATGKDRRDFLTVEPDVQALASVLASADTVPPLSVGLFGNWGSGKSFFMAMLRDHIKRLATESSSAKQTVFCKQIAQIEFNAWHYLDGNLWASLVSHILERLKLYFRGDSKTQAEAAKATLGTNELLRAELAKQQRKTTDDKAALLAEIADSDLTNEEIARATAGQLVQKVVEAKPAVQQALHTVEQQLDVPQGTLTLAGLRQLRSDWRLFWRRIRKHPRLLWTGALLILAGSGAAALVGIAQHWTIAGITFVGGAAAGVAATLAKVVRPVTRAVREALREGEEASKVIAEPPDFARRRAEIERADAETKQKLADLDRRDADARVKLEAAAEPSMREYVLKRFAESDYRSKLGIIASVHRDFQNLSDQLSNQSTDPKLERIILYIDDLDRCPPERVVEVLQAIHLLLSFELFIVVVAVDPTWLTRSLAALYARQFPRDPDDETWESRPQFYLEKIFQIPYALRPMSTDGFGALVDGLLGSAVVRDAAPAPQSTPAPSAAPAQRAPTAPAVAPATPPPPRRTATPAPATPVDLNPRNLEITEAELHYLRDLGPLVGSPRSAKRLVNLYRILRAGLDADALDELEAGRFQLTQLVLAAVVGCPLVAREWLEPILHRTECPPTEILASLDERGEQAKFLRARLAACTDELADWRHVRDVCGRAVRFSFETGPLLDAL